MISKKKYRNELIDELTSLINKLFNDFRADIARLVDSHLQSIVVKSIPEYQKLMYELKEEVRYLKEYQQALTALRAACEKDEKFIKDHMWIINFEKFNERIDELDKKLENYSCNISYIANKLDIDLCDR